MTPPTTPGPTDLRPGMGLLLNILCLYPSDTDWIAAPDSTFNLVLDLAEENRVLPLVAHRLQHLAPSLTEPIQHRLDTIARDSRFAAFWWTAELKGLLTQLAEHRIDVIPLKGPSLAERLYGDAHLRPSSDLDLLVRSAQLPEARQFLTQLGFSLKDPDNGYHQLWARGTTALELHHDLADPARFQFHIDTAWARTFPITFAGQPALGLGPPDELLFLCLHGTRHCFEHLGYILDIALFLDHLAATSPSPSSIPELALRSETGPLLGVVVLGCELAQHLRAGRPLPFRIPTTPRRAALEKIAGQLWHQLLTQSPTPQRWTTIRRFYRHTELTRYRYFLRLLRDARDAATLLIEADYEFAARFGVHSDRTWLIYILRYFRLALRRTSPTAGR